MSFRKLRLKTSILIIATTFSFAAYSNLIPASEKKQLDLNKQSTVIDIEVLEPTTSICKDFPLCRDIPHKNKG